MSAIHHTQDDARPEANRPVDKIATSQEFNSASGIPTYCSCPNGCALRGIATSESD